MSFCLCFNSCHYLYEVFQVLYGTTYCISYEYYMNILFRQTSFLRYKVVSQVVAYICWISCCTVIALLKLFFFVRVISPDTVFLVIVSPLTSESGEFLFECLTVLYIIFRGKVNFLIVRVVTAFVYNCFSFLIG